MFIIKIIIQIIKKSIENISRKVLKLHPNFGKMQTIKQKGSD